MTFTPTEEQDVIVGLFGAGDSMAVEAGAGTGKSTTLRLAAESTRRRGTYVAFNAATVADARRRMPRTCRPSTAHGLARRANGHVYFDRVDGDRMRSSDLAKLLRVESFTVHYGSQRKVLQPGFLAGHVMRAVKTFCTTGDDHIGVQHVGYIDGIDLPDAEGHRTHVNNIEVKRLLEPALHRAWADIANPVGVLPFTHDCYLKLWQLDGPRILGQYLLVDEAQDLNGCQLAIVVAQDGAQVVWVGDSQQQIYGWRGAHNALGRVDAAHRAFLTQSWRFGPEVAGVANALLTCLNADLRIVGAPHMDSRLDELDTGWERSDAVLCRTNARAVEEVLFALEDGRRPHLVGGGDEVLRFARAADELKTTGHTSYPDLACFTSWGEVKGYVEEDPQGGDLALLVALMDNFGVDVIVAALGNQPDEATADVVVSTAHKAKGREWPRVRLANDFPDEHDPNDLEQTRLAYVAVTRARDVLDCTAAGIVNKAMAGA